MLAKIRKALTWIGAAAVAIAAAALFWRVRPKPKLEVINNPAACPAPLPSTQAGVDAELKKLRRIK